MINLKKTVRCIHCWSEFPVADTLWLSEHEDLKVDMLLPDQPARFLPSRFGVSGNALDAKGQECHLLACPRCHLAIPRSITERDVMFVSILGSPQSGKSYYLASLIHKLRKELPKYFDINLADADLNGNSVLTRYEKELFLRAKGDEAIVLGDLIPKTQLGGLLYNTVNYGNQTVSYPKPFTFNLDPGIPGIEKSRKMLCLYDNAGEHYEAGRDSNQDPGTRHMAQADFLMFVYDPTQDSRWQSALGSDIVADHFSENTSFQEHILLEAANRIRTINGLSDGERIDKPLFVVVCKLDVWKRLLPRMDWHPPIIKEGGKIRFDVSRFIEQSEATKETLRGLTPTIVNAAESVSRANYFIPVTAIGTAPTQFSDSGAPMIKPSEISPKRVTIPFLAGLVFSNQELILTTR